MRARPSSVDPRPSVQVRAPCSVVKLGLRSLWRSSATLVTTVACHRSSTDASERTCGEVSSVQRCAACFTGKQRKSRYIARPVEAGCAGRAPAAVRLECRAAERRPQACSVPVSGVRWQPSAEKPRARPGWRACGAARGIWREPRPPGPSLTNTAPNAYTPHSIVRTRCDVASCHCASIVLTRSHDLTRSHTISQGVACEWKERNHAKDLPCDDSTQSKSTAFTLVVASTVPSPRAPAWWCSYSAPHREYAIEPSGRHTCRLCKPTVGAIAGQCSGRSVPNVKQRKMCGPSPVALPGSVLCTKPLPKQMARPRRY